jgi:hypothetical protein
MKALAILLWLGVLTWVSGAGVLGYWVADRDSPIDLWTVKSVRAEDNRVQLDVDLRVNRACEFRIRAVLINDTVIEIPFRGGIDRAFITSPLNTRLSVTDSYNIPLHPGSYKYQAVHLFWCNPLQKALNMPITVRHEPFMFEVQ